MIKFQFLILVKVIALNTHQSTPGHPQLELGG